MNVFDVQRPVIRWLTEAFVDWAFDGQGPAHSTVSLESVELRRSPTEREAIFIGQKLVCEVPEAARLPIEVSGNSQARRIRIDFLSPTELKGDGAVLERPEFAIMVQRAFERANALSTLYGNGPLPLDWAHLKAQAALVKTVAVEGRHLAIRRTSRTTGVHPLGGFVGRAVYEGEVSAFVPLLRIAEVTGIGRQTVWGKGEIAVHVT
jgi:hypothetical protein